ncbi:MAG: hypothetical protein U0002_10385 [Thermoanaerobaculia bacterium]
MDRRTLFRHYFRPWPAGAVYCLACVVLILVFARTGLLLNVTLLTSALGASGWIAFYFKRPTDEEVDTWIDNDARDLLPRALTHCGLDDSQLVSDTVWLRVPDWSGKAGLRCYFRQGRNRVLRFSPSHFTVIHFTQHQLACYQCFFDHTTGNALCEDTRTYSYKDIVSIEVQSHAVTRKRSELTWREILFLQRQGIKVINNQVQYTDRTTLLLTTKASTQIEVTLRSFQILQGLNQATFDTTATDLAIRSIRKMLADHAEK